MRMPRALIIAIALVVALVVQTTLFAQIRVVTPDLVLLLAILLSLTRIRPELVLLTGFCSGLVVDLIGSSILGLRAVVFTIVAYIGLRTRQRAELGRFAAAIWAGLLSLVGVVLLVVIGTLFGQTSLLGPDVFRTMGVVSAANLVLAAMFAPAFVRLIDGDPTVLRFS